MMLNELRQIKNERFSGIYRMTGRVASFDDEGIPYLRLRLSNAEGDFVVLAVIESVTLPQRLGHLELVEVKGQVYSDSEEDVVLLSAVNRPRSTTVFKLPALETLPRTYCPVQDTLDKLVEQVRALESPHLQVLVSRVLERKELLEVFLKAPASRDYHHRSPGGLLFHSLEVANGVLDMIQAREPQMPKHLQEIGFVAGLLHDIGKTYTTDIYGMPTPVARLCDHGDLTLEASAYGLAYLDKVDPDGAMALRHIWTCASQGVRYGYPSALTLARYIHDADGASAARDTQRYGVNNVLPISRTKPHSGTSAVSAR